MRLVRETEMDPPAAADCHGDDPLDAAIWSDSASSVDPAQVVPSQEFLALIAPEYARRHQVLSAGRIGEFEVLLVGEQTPEDVPFAVAARLNRSVLKLPGLGSAIATAIDHWYTRTRRRADSSQSGPQHGLRLRNLMRRSRR